MRITIFIFLSLIFTSYYFVNEVFSERTNSTKSDTGFKSPERGKIHPIITEWKTSTDPASFASENDLQYSEGKIRVYLYLDDAESISKLPTDVDLLSSSDNIAVAYLDGRQITQLSQLDFVQRIEPPITGTFMQKTIQNNYSEKIAEVIQQWQSTSDPASFASENDLQYSEGKIRVYLYLDDAESISKLPTDVDLLSSSDNIAVAYLDGRQITQLSQLDFVQRIEPPASGIFGPPQIPDNESIDETFLYSGIAVIIAVIIAGFVVISRIRKIAKKF